MVEVGMTDPSQNPLLNEWTVVGVLYYSGATQSAVTHQSVLDSIKVRCTRCTNSEARVRLQWLLNEGYLITVPTSPYSDRTRLGITLKGLELVRPHLPRLHSFRVFTRP